MARRGPFVEIEGMIGAWRDRVVEQARDAMVDTAAEGADSVRQTITLSVTGWGLARQAGLAGPPRASAGRIETGSMIGAVDHRITVESEDLIEVKWGWEDPEIYYLIQEYGFEEFSTKIAPMFALRTSLDYAEASLEERLRSIS